MEAVRQAMLPEFIQSQHIITAVIVCLICFLIYILKPKNLPPGPMGWPLLGYLPGLFPDPLVSFCNLADKYGKILSIRMGPQLVVMLSDYETLRSAYVSRADEFSDNMIMSWVLESKRDVGKTSCRTYTLSKKVSFKPKFHRPLPHTFWKKSPQVNITRVGSEPLDICKN